MNMLLKRGGYRALRWGSISLLIRPRILIACGLLMLLVLLIAAGSLVQGHLRISSSEVLNILSGAQVATREQSYILWDIRLPRILMAVLCGAMLGTAGAAMQSITRNGLADPGLIGVKEAASIVVLAIIIFAPTASLFWRPLAGMAGGLAAALLVVVLARDLSRTRFVLIGIGVSWMLSAGISIFMTTANIRDVQTALIWLSGSLHTASWSSLSMAAAWGLVGSIMLLGSARASDAALLGDPIAVGLGIRRQLLATVRFIAPVLLTAASVSCVGNLGFVGLIAPHIARFVLGGNQFSLLTGSALFGAGMILVADTIGRLAFAPLQLPAGIVMSVIGVPFFLALLWRRRERL